MFSSFYPAVQIFPQPGIGSVVEPITTTRQGRVKSKASYWPGRLHEVSIPTRLLPMEIVLVVGREGMILLVQPDPLGVDAIE